MKRIVAVTLAAGLLTLSGVAFAFSRGGYDGTTAQGEDVSFNVTKKKVKRIGYVVRGSCESGASFSFTNSPDVGPPVRIKKNGRFKETTEGSSSDAVIVGKVRNNGRARGTVRAHTRGPVEGFGRCSTPKVRWQARK